MNESIDRVINKIYKSSSKDVSWTAYDTKILKIKQVYGIVGA
ncbi:hypothetical protein [Metabacillus fastidiosus]